jgi:hypothetical protein
MQATLTLLNALPLLVLEAPTYLPLVLNVRRDALPSRLVYIWKSIVLVISFPCFHPASSRLRAPHEN